MLTLHELWLLLQAIWNTGNRWARWVVSLSLGWPIVLVLVALLEEPVITALFALVAGVMFIFLAIFLLDPVLIGILAAQDSIRRFLRFLASLVAVEVAMGIYFSVTPVWENGDLIPLLFLAAIALVFLKLGLPGKLSRLAGLMSVIMIVITLSFFLPRSFERARNLPERIDSTIVNLVEGKSILTQVPTAVQPRWPTEEFRLNKGDTVKTVFAQPGMNYQIEANRQWLLLCGNHPGGHMMSTGRECIQGADPPGLVTVVGLADGTLLAFQRVR